MRDPIFDYRITSYDRSLLPNPLLALLEKGVDGPAKWVEKSGLSVGHPVWGLLYHLLLTVLSPTERNVIVEVGTNLGSSTIALAQALIDSGRPGVIHTIEIEPGLHEEAMRRLDLAGVAPVVVGHVGDSVVVLPQLVAEHAPLAVAFLDGNHLHDQVVREFEVVRPAMRQGGLVLFDNTHQLAEGKEDPRVAGALRTIVARHGGHLINLPYCSWYTPGFAIWQRSPFADMTPPALPHPDAAGSSPA